MLKKTFKELGGHTMIYSLAWLASSAASILLLPVYTRFLSREDYGILELLDYTNVVLLIIVIAGLNAAIPKFFNDAEDEREKKAVISTATLFVLFSGTIVCGTAMLFSDSLSLLILGKSEYKYLIILNLVLLYVQLFIQVSGVGFISEKKSKVYLCYMLAKLVLAVIFNLYFIVVLRLGVLGMLYGNIIANSITASAVTIHNIRVNGIRFDKLIMQKLLKFGTPLIPATVAATIMHNADRFLIRHYCSLEDVGIYGIGYKFPFMLNMLIIQSFNLIWSGATMYEISKKPDAAYQYGRITTYILGLYITIQFALSVFSASVIKIFADPKFFAAQEVIPIIAIGLCFHSLYFFFSVGTFLKKKTWMVNYAYFPAAILNIVGNMYLLPKYGYMAAAWMTLITYVFFSGILYFTCRKLVKVEYEFKRLAMLFLISVVTYKISTLYVFDNLLIEIVKGCVFIGIYFLLLYLTGWFTAGEKVILKDKLLNFRGYLLH